MADQKKPLSETHPWLPEQLKPVAAVHLPAIAECDEKLLEPGTLRKGAVAWLEKLQKTHHITIVTPIANTWSGHKVMLNWLGSLGVPFDDVWTGFGYPEYDKVITDASKS